MRNLYSLNQGWTLSFPKGERETETVNLPHTWNGRRRHGRATAAICALLQSTPAPSRRPPSRWPAAVCMLRSPPQP